MVRALRVRVVGEGDELLAEAEHLDRMRFHAVERLGRAVDQQALGRQAEPDRGRVTERLARQPLQPARDLIVPDIDVDADHGAGRDPNAGVRPAVPDGKLVLGGRPRAMLGPAADSRARRHP